MHCLAKYGQGKLYIYYIADVKIDYMYVINTMNSVKYTGYMYVTNTMSNINAYHN